MSCARMIIVALAACASFGCADNEGQKASTPGAANPAPPKEKPACQAALEQVWEGFHEAREQLSALGQTEQHSKESYVGEGAAFIERCKGLKAQEQACIGQKKAQALRNPDNACRLPKETLSALHERLPSLLSKQNTDIAAVPGSPFTGFRPLPQSEVAKRLKALTGTWQKNNPDSEEGAVRWTVAKDGAVVEQDATRKKKRHSMMHHHRLGFMLKGERDPKSGISAGLPMYFFQATPDVFYLLGGGTLSHFQPVASRDKFTLAYEHGTGAAAAPVDRPLKVVPTSMKDDYYIEYEAKRGCRVLDLVGFRMAAACEFEKKPNGEESFTTQFTPINADKPLTATFVVVGNTFLSDNFRRHGRFARVKKTGKRR